MRRATLLGSLLVLAAAAPARAQPYARTGDPPTGGVLLPAAGTTLRDDAASLEVNPAQTAFLRSWNLTLAHTELPGSARYLGTGTALFAAGRVPLLPVAISAGLQLLRPGDGFGGFYPALGKLSLGLAVEATRWLAIGLSGHVFVTPENDLVNGVTTLDAGITVRPAPWIALAITARDLTNPRWQGLPLQRLWDLEAGFRPRVDGRVAFALGVRVGERRGDVAPRAILTVEPYPGLTLLADATYLRRDLDAADGREDRRHDVRVTAGLRLDFSHAGVTAAFVGGRGGLPGGAAAGGHVAVRISGSRHRSVTRDVRRAVLLEYGGNGSIEGHLRFVSALRSLRRDRSVAAVLLRLGGEPGWAIAEELRDAIAELRRAGKPVITYLFAVGAGPYYVALASSRILLLPGGGLRFAGLHSTQILLKQALDRLGIRAEILRHAEYKTAPEPLLNTTPSREALEVREALLGDISGRFHRALATRPGIRTVERARAVLDQGPFTPAEALSLGLVDRLVEPDQAQGDVWKHLGQAYPVERLPVTAAHPVTWGLPPAVAVIRVEGDIVEGESQTIPLINRRTAGARTLLAALDAAARSPRIKAVVLRVDSGGGSALASEVLHRAIERLARGKPVYASLGNVAASGGYFVAAPAREIFAEPSTLTGSIGIFAGKVDLSGLLAKIGVTTSTGKRGLRADAESPWRPYTDEERRVLTAKLRYYYERFLDAVARGRKGLGTRERVHAVARGRLWTGDQARQRGLVDRIGGLADALDAARRAAGLREGDGHEVVVLPGPEPGIVGRALRALVRPKAAASAPLLARLLAPLAALPSAFWLADAPEPLMLLPDVIEIR
jgi:protease-4